MLGSKKQWLIGCGLLVNLAMGVAQDSYTFSDSFEDNPTTVSRTLVINTPVNGAVVPHDVAIPINGTATPNARVYVTVNSASVCRVDSSSIGEWSCNIPVSFAQPSTTLVIKADTAGVQTKTVTISTSSQQPPSNSKPVVSNFIVNDTNTTAVTGRFSISDADGEPVKNLRIHISENYNASGCTIDVGSYFALQSTGNKFFSGNCSGTLTRTGIYYARVEARDASGNPANVKHTTFNYTKPVNQAPTISSFSVSDTSNTTVSGNFSISDPDGDQVKNLRVSVGSNYDGSDCIIDVGSYNSLQNTGSKSFGGSCASVLTSAGTYHAKVEAKDEKGKVAQTKYVTFMYSPVNHAPAISGFNVNDTTTTTVNGYFNISDSDGDQVKNLRVSVSRNYNGSDCVIDVGSYNSLQSVGYKSFSGSCASVLTSGGTYHAKVEAKDEKGKSANVEYAIFSYQPVNQAPTISNFSVSDTSNTTVSGNFSISDPDGDQVKNLRISVSRNYNGSDCMIDVGSYTNSQSTGYKSFSGNCSSVLTSSGTYYAKVEAKDTNGNQATVRRTTFNYNPPANQPPVVSGFSVNNTSTTSVSGGFSISDPDGDYVKNLRIHVSSNYDGSDCMIDVGSYTNSQSTGYKSFSGNCSSVLTSSGTYYAKVEAKDTNGNQATVRRTTFSYSPPVNQAPVVSGFSVNNTNTTSVSGSFSISDPDGDYVKNLRIHVSSYYDGSQCMIDVGYYNSSQSTGYKSFSGNCSSVLTSSGTYYAKVEAKDTNGNQATVRRTTFSYNPPINQAPVVSSFSVNNTSTTSVSGSFSISDPDGDYVKNLRIHVSRNYNGSDCMIDVGYYNSSQSTGYKSFSGNCSSVLTSSGTYYAKVEANDTNGNQAAVRRTTFSYSPPVQNRAPVVSSFSVNNTSTTSVSGSFSISDPDGDYVKNLRIHVSRNYNGSDCMIDVGYYNSSQSTGYKSFSGNCSSVLTSSGIYHAKVEARDTNGNQAAVRRTTFSYSPPWF